MRKVIMQVNISLDGFTAGPNDELDWPTHDAEAWDLLFEDFHKVDTVLMGRINYEGFHYYWPPVANDVYSPTTDRAFARWFDEMPKVVFSHTLDRVEWKNARIAQADCAAEIAQLKAQPGKDLLIMNSTRLAHSLMTLGLIDEYWITVHPVAIGCGRPLFIDLQEQMRLKLLDSRRCQSGTIFLRYERVATL